MSRAPLAADPGVRRIPPRVHGAWTHRWWNGDAALTELLGTPPGLASLDEAARRVDRLRPTPGWERLLHGSGPALASDALIVLAGQQPVLAGGPALVAHKAATALSLAHDLERRWQRPVKAVFLLATEDHDSSEVDHVDHINPATGRLQRTRCHILPGQDAFCRSHWESAGLEGALRRIIAAPGDGRTLIEEHMLQMARVGPEEPGVAAHVGNLLAASFGSSGLMTVQAHQLTARATGLMGRALADTTALRRLLELGRQRAVSAGLVESFDPEDPRPLLLESSDGKRRRLDPRDVDAASRMARTPEDFSPHAALRPVVQAATLPVVAQICGPSELRYLGQARGLHNHFGAPAPVLVPRLEATAVPRADLRALGIDLAAFSLDDSPATVAQESGLAEALRAYADDIAARDPSLRARAARLAARTLRDAHRLTEALTWRGRTPPGRWEHLNPRGRPQDTVLAWLPDAWAHNDPAAWGRRIVGLARPLDPPMHVLHTAPLGDP